MPIVNVYVVRHGETAENAEGIIQGQLDTQLNELGRTQAARVGDYLSAVAFDHAYTSDLSRARDTAQAIVDRQTNTALTLVSDGDLRERYLGDMEGKRASSGQRVPPNAESGESLVARCLAWWDRAVIPLARRKNPASSINVLAVSHGAWIGTLIRSGLASRNYRGWDRFGGPLFNSSVTLVRVDEGGRLGEIVNYADVSHLLMRKVNGRWELPSANNADVLSNEDEEERRAILYTFNFMVFIPGESKKEVRHGETDANRQGIIQGQLETDLNETGREQSRRMARALKDVEFVHGFVSNLGRAVESASFVMKTHPDLKWTIHPGLRERYFGELQGKKRTGADHPPSVEAMDQYVERILQWWDRDLIASEVVQQQFETNKDEVRNILVIGHGSYLANLIKALGSQRGFDVGAAGRGKAYNTGISIIQTNDRHASRGQLIQYSDVTHLEGMAQGVVQVNVDDIDKKAGRTQG
ncbi:hypothetical protein FRB90_000572 [Tulasnella sp. 427]|nr:hypothetical protein FRB90_000572 [Tulasnella sp. 427]